MLAPAHLDLCFWLTRWLLDDAHSSQDLEAPFQLLKRDLYPLPAAGSAFLVRDWHSPHCAAGAKAVESGCVHLAAASGEAVVELPSPGRKWPASSHGFNLFTITAATPGRWVLLGELGKFVTVAASRFSGVRADGDGLELTVRGGAGEQVALTALKPAGADWEVVRKTVVVGADGEADVVLK